MMMDIYINDMKTCKILKMENYINNEKLEKILLQF